MPPFHKRFVVGCEVVALVRKSEVDREMASNNPIKAGDYTLTSFVSSASRAHFFVALSSADESAPGICPVKYTFLLLCVPLAVSSGWYSKSNEDFTSLLLLCLDGLCLLPLLHPRIRFCSGSFHSFRLFTVSWHDNRRYYCGDRDNGQYPSPTTTSPS